MNILKTYTLATEQPDTFVVYWTNNNRQPKGILRVRVVPQMEDRHIVAELAAMQHLLENKGVLGNTVIGNPNTKLVVSMGAIRKLQSMKSDKSHLAPYSNFLVTRFADCPVSVDKKTDWFNGAPLDTAEVLLVNEPARETVSFTGLGEVCVTNHVLNRISERYLSAAEQSAQAAWKKLRELASDSSVREVTRHSLQASAKYEGHGKQEGRYFLNARHNLVLVVTNNHGEGRRLVTAYPVNQQFHVMPTAA